MLSYCMVTAILHEFCHTALILPYCMDTGILHGYGHTASIDQDTDLLGILGVSLLHACRFSSRVLSGAWANSLAKLLKTKKLHAMHR